MKRVTYIALLLLALTAFALPAQANRHDRGSSADREQWDREMRQFRNEYFTRELNLTADQQTRFFALYDAMEAERNALFKKVRDAADEVEAKGSSATSADYKRVVDMQYNLKAQEAAIEQRYYQEFKQVLSWRQLYHLKKAERELRRMLQKQVRDKKDKKDKKKD